jgi:hypothetical protein
VAVTPGVCPYPTVGKICTVEVKENGRGGWYDELSFYQNQDDRYTELISSERGGTSLPDLQEVAPQSPMADRFRDKPFCLPDLPFDLADMEERIRRDLARLTT